MIEVFLEGMLGTFGGSVLDFMQDNPTYVAGLMAIWLALLAAGQIQLWYIQRKTAELVVELSPDFIAQNPHITSDDLYHYIYPSWSEALPEWAWFVPHRLGLWPATVRTETVTSNFLFSPQWIADVLHKHGIELDEHETNNQAN